MTRKDKIEMRTQFATILNKVLKKHEPCDGGWQDCDEYTRRNEFYKMSELYYELTELRDTMYKMNKYAEMLED